MESVRAATFYLLTTFSYNCWLLGGARRGGKEQGTFLSPVATVGI